MASHPGAGSAALAVAASGGQAAPPRVIAIVQAAGQRIGIDGAQVVQAVVVPADMAAVPRRAGGIVGVIVRGEQLVPVVRLERWLQAPTDAGAEEEGEAAADAGSSSPDARIVILSDGALVVGLLVEAVVGMQRCPAGAMARLFHDDRPDELFACAVGLEAGAPPLPLIEPARLAALAGVWSEAAGLSTPGSPTSGQAAASGGSGAALTPRTSVGVFRVGDRLVGIPVADIGELVPTPALRPSPVRHPSTRGLCDWRDRLLPVVHIGGLLAAMPQDEAPRWMCVVRHGDMVLGVLVDEIVELHAAAMPPGDGACDALVRRELPIERGILQVLDTAQLMARCPESCISLRGNAQARQQGASTNPHTWLVFDAAGTYATRIDCVQEIVSLPAGLRPRLDAGLAVSLQWRGHAVPVRALFAAQGLAVAARDARLLIVVVADGCRIAVPIAGVKAMIAPRTSTLARLRVRTEIVDVVSTAAGADRASYEVVDIAARAAGEPGLQQAA